MMRFRSIGCVCFSLFTAQSVFATEASALPMGSSGLVNGLMLTALAIITYFMVIRPQTKRAKEHQTLVTGLQKGDEIITTGGILGKITRITDAFIVMMIAEGVEVSIQKQAIVSAVPQGTLKSI